MAAVDLSTTVGTLTLKNPLMPASGTFGYGEEFGDYFDLNKMGALVTKAISPLPRPGNPPPRIVEQHSGMLNSIGLQNVGVDMFVEEKLKFLENFQVPVIVNVVGNDLQEYCEVVERLSGEQRVAGFEINLSCPNVSKGLRYGTTVDGIAEIIGALRKLTDRPLWAKLSPQVPNPAELGLAAQNAGADALVAINTLGGMAIDVKKRRPLLGNRFGGLSGPAIKPVALKFVWQLFEAVSIPVIGVGGIMELEDVLAFLMAGATAVQVGTAGFVVPDVIPQLVEELAEWCETNHVKSVYELVGAAHQA